MIDYGQEAKRTLFVDENKRIYTRIESQGQKPSFVEVIRTPNEFRERSSEKYPFDPMTIQVMSNVDLKSLDSGLDIILDLNVELLRLKESAAFLTKISNKQELKEELSAKVEELENVVNALTHSWTSLGKQYPNYAYNYRSALFEIPGAVGRIMAGEETFKDAYGTVETSNHKAFRSLLIRDMMGGKEVFTPEELTRVDNHGLEKNQRLEKEYQAKEKKF